MREDEFQELITRSRYGERMRQGAYLVLVKGLSMTEAAKQVGTSRSRIREVVARIKRLHLDSQKCVAGRSMR